MSAPQPRPTPERRHNRSLRNQAQAWLDALRLHIAEVEKADDIAPLIKAWKKPEDIMYASPALVPVFLDTVWHARKMPAFADLFRTESGAVAEGPTEVLALSQKSFDDIVIAHLMGTIRLWCERQQNKWIVLEQARRRSDLSRMPIVGLTLRSLGFFAPVKAEILLVDYPQKGLYEALKPFLRRRDQFELVEALSTMPTRTVTTLGPIIGALTTPAAILALAGLKRPSVKIAIELAETFDQAVSGSSPKAKEQEVVDRSAAIGTALSDMLSVGAKFVATATDDRQLAKDAIAKLAPIMMRGVWTTFGDAASLRRIVECPTAVAANLKELTGEVSERVSIALSEIADSRVATYAMKALRDDINPKIFRAWIQDETYLPAWKQLVANLNRYASLPPAGEDLGAQHKAPIKTVCNRGARVFAELAEPMKQAA